MRHSLFPYGLCLFAATMPGPSAAQIVDVAAGAKRAQVCFACHGEKGVSVTPGTPHLAGQDRRYLEAALRAYRDGRRQDPTMGAMAKPLSDADISNIAAYFHLSNAVPETESLADLLAVQQRLAPAGAVRIGASTIHAALAPVATEPAAPRSSAAVYRSACAACHDTGAAGAPKMGDAAAWKDRLARGAAGLKRHAIEGFNAMPARGACAQCSNDEIEAVVRDMIERAGG